MDCLPEIKNAWYCLYYLQSLQTLYVLCHYQHFSFWVQEGLTSLLPSKMDLKSNCSVSLTELYWLFPPLFLYLSLLFFSFIQHLLKFIKYQRMFWVEDKNKQINGLKSYAFRLLGQGRLLFRRWSFNIKKLSALE